MVVETLRPIADVGGEYKIKHATRRKAGKIPPAPSGCAKVASASSRIRVPDPQEVMGESREMMAAARDNRRFRCLEIRGRLRARRAGIESVRGNV
jgi:hypothetical protein